MRHLFKCLRRGLKLLREILRAAREQIHPVQQGRSGPQRTRIIQNRERFIEVPILDLELRELNEGFRQHRQPGGISAQLTEGVQGIVTSSGAQLGSREMPLRKRAARLDRILRPAAQLLARWLPLGAIDLIELLENHRQLRIGRMMFDEIFQRIVPSFRCAQSQICIRDCAQGRDEHRAAHAFGRSHDRLEKLDRPLVVIQLGLEPSLKKTLQFLVTQRRRPCFIEEPLGGRSILFIEQ